jgi:prepilin-type N-terminal cleavage/methylation domain-containing protein
MNCVANKKMVYKMKKNGDKGFTIMELLVAVAIFSMVFVAVSASFISVIDAYQKVTATRTNVDNLTIALESMVRGAKTGLNYHCGDGDYSVPKNCASSAGDTTFAFTNVNVPRPLGISPSLPIVYKFEATGGAYPGRIQRSNDGGTTFYPVTVAPPTLKITYMKFYVFGSQPYPGDMIQPQVIIVLKGNVGVKEKVMTPFDVQTTITQRVLDVEI